MILRRGVRRRHIDLAGSDIRLPQRAQPRHLAPGVTKRDDPGFGKRRKKVTIDRQCDCRSRDRHAW